MGKKGAPRPGNYSPFRQAASAGKVSRWALLVGAAVIVGAVLLLWFGDEDGTLAELAETPITDTITDAYYVMTERRAMAHQVAACEHDFGGEYMRRWEQGRHDICPPHAGWVRTHTPLGAASKVQCWETESGPLVACLSTNVIVKPSGGGRATTGLSCGTWSRKIADDDDAGGPDAGEAYGADVDVEPDPKAGKAAKPAGKAEAKAAGGGKKKPAAAAGGGDGGGDEYAAEGKPDRSAGRKLRAGEEAAEEEEGAAGDAGGPRGSLRGSRSVIRGAAGDDADPKATPPKPADGSLAGPAALPSTARPPLQQWLGRSNVKPLSAKRVRALCKGPNAITQPVLLVERQDTINLYHSME
jgi:hypothetical protein